MSLVGRWKCFTWPNRGLLFGGRPGFLVRPQLPARSLTRELTEKRPAAAQREGLGDEEREKQDKWKKRRRWIEPTLAGLCVAGAMGGLLWNEKRQKGEVECLRNSKLLEMLAANRKIFPNLRGFFLTMLKDEKFKAELTRRLTPLATSSVVATLDNLMNDQDFNRRLDQWVSDRIQSICTEPASVEAMSNLIARSVEQEVVLQAVSDQLNDIIVSEPTQAAITNSLNLATQSGEFQGQAAEMANSFLKTVIQDNNVIKTLNEGAWSIARQMFLPKFWISRSAQLPPAASSAKTSPETKNLIIDAAVDAIDIESRAQPT